MSPFVIPGVGVAKHGIISPIVIPGVRHPPDAARGGCDPYDPGPMDALGTVAR